MTSLRREGLDYEAAVQRYFREKFGKSFSDSHIFSFEVEGKERVLQPDGLLFREPKWITLVEIKLWPSARPLYQLEHVYGPVVREYFKGIPIHYLLVCRETRGKVQKWPEQPYLTSDPLRTTESGVWLWILNL